MSHSITFLGANNTQKSKGLVETTIASANVTVASTPTSTVSLAHATPAVFVCGVPDYAFWSGQNAISATNGGFLNWITLPFANGSYQAPDGSYRSVGWQFGSSLSFVPSLPAANNSTLFALTVNGSNFIAASNDPTYPNGLYATAHTPQQTAQVLNSLINAQGMAYNLDTTTANAYTQFIDYAPELMDDYNLSGPFFSSTIGSDGITITVTPGPGWPTGTYLTTGNPAGAQWEIDYSGDSTTLPGGQGVGGNLTFGITTGNVTLPAAPAMAFLTGILYDSTGNPQTIPVTAPGTVGTVSVHDNADQGHVVIDSATVTAFQNSGLQKNKNNVQLTWNPQLSNVAVTMLDSPGNTSFGEFEISTSDYNALVAAGLVAEQTDIILLLNGVQRDEGLLYTPSDAGSPDSQYTFISYNGNRSYTALLGQQITFQFIGNAGEPAGTVWNNGSWDGANNIHFASLPAGVVPTVVGQTFTASQLVGNAKGTYKVVLYDATGTVANSYTVSDQIDYDQDRLNGFNPPPLVSLRLDNTYGIDSASGLALTGSDLNNQVDQNLSYTLLDSTVIGPQKRGMTTSARDKNNMLAAGFIHKDLVFTVTGSAGGPQKAHWTKNNGKFHFLSKLPTNFAGPYVVTATLPYSNDQMVLALDPVRFATGSIKIIYSGTLDNTVALQVLSGAVLQSTYPTMNWPPQDETLQSFGLNSPGLFRGVATQVPFEVTLDGSGNTTMTINFSIT